jgi:hypothetical protein
LTQYTKCGPALKPLCGATGSWPIAHSYNKTGGVNSPTTLHAVLISAARAFNAGEYFEAHEVLEDALETVPDHLFELFVGLIQIAVGYHKATQKLWSGARRMLHLGREKLVPFPAEAAGINLEALRQRVDADLEKLHSGRFDLEACVRHPPRLQPLVEESNH